MAGAGLLVPWELIGFVVAGLAVYEVLRARLRRWWRLRGEQRVDRFLREHRIPNDPFRHTHRVVVREQVLSDPTLTEAMAARARTDGLPVRDVQNKVRAWLDEIVPQFNLFAYYRVGYAFGRTTAYTMYNVRLDQESLDRAQAAIPDGAAVVYVSNHRSNADFVVTGFMLSKSVQISYAVGEWARIWPLESLFKSFGSYFVRRGEKDPLYHQTLEAYLQLITKQGVTQAMFPEGGLSRDGALRPVKLGLLDYMAKAKLDPTFTAPLVFVPVGINFDRVMEDENLIKEDAGAIGRPKRSLPQKAWRLTTLLGKGLYGVPINLGRFLAKRVRKHGVVGIHFGEPLSFDDWYKRHGDDGFLGEPDRHARHEKLRPFGELLLGRIEANIPATPATLLCLAATELGRRRMETGVDRGDLILALRSAMEAVQAAGRPLLTGDPYEADARRREAARAIHRADVLDVTTGIDDADDLDGVLERGLDVTGRRGLVCKDGALYRSEPSQWKLVEYYANSLRDTVDRAEEPGDDAIAMDRAALPPASDAAASEVGSVQSPS